jgi:hypothetical protein
MTREGRDNDCIVTMFSSIDQLFSEKSIMF